MNAVLEYENELDDIGMCLRTLYSTVAGTQPMDREFGIDISAGVDEAPNVAENMIALEIIEKTERYEPRVEVESVTFRHDATNGILIPVIRVVNKDEDEIDEEDED